MDKILDFLTNFSFIIIVFILLIDEKKNKKNELNNIVRILILILTISTPILIMLRYGKIFLAVLNQFFYFIIYIYIIYDSISYSIMEKEKPNLNECLFNLIVTIYFVGGIYCIYSRIKSEKEYLENVADKIKSMNYKETFWKIINNNWLQGICIGIISTVVGGIILNKIISNNSKNKDKNEENNTIVANKSNDKFCQESNVKNMANNHIEIKKRQERNKKIKTYIENILKEFDGNFYIILCIYNNEGCRLGLKAKFNVKIKSFKIKNIKFDIEGNLIFLTIKKEDDNIRLGLKKIYEKSIC